MHARVFRWHRAKKRGYFWWSLVWNLILIECPHPRVHTADYISSAVSLLHRVGLVHRSDRDILWGAFWPKIVLMALVRYKKFVHKNRACSNIKNKTTLPTKSCNILQIRLDNLPRYFTLVSTVATEFKRSSACRLSVCERVTSVTHWPMNCFIELIRKSDQSWSRWIWSVCWYLSGNGSKRSENGSKRSENDP